MNESLAIETRGLSKVYGSGNTEVVAMRDATMAVRRGEVIALLGPSGAGKSTFLTAVGLINPPTSGQIFIGGVLVLDGPVPLVNLRTFRREHIGFIFQKSNLIPFLSARENVQIALELNGASPRGRGVGPWNCWKNSGLRTVRKTGRPCSRAASSSGWPSPGPWPTTPA